MLRSGAWRADAGLVKGGDEAGEQIGEGLALLVCPAADRMGELGAPVVVHLVKVGAAAALDSASQCGCAWNGTITVEDAGQTAVTLS